ACVIRCLARDEAAAARPIAGGGAAGGLPAGLIAAGWGRVESGFETVAREVRLEPRLRTATICVTGEGRLDSQTGRGKVVSGVARLGRKLGVPVVALAGEIQLAWEQTMAECLAQLGLTDAVPITPIGTPRKEALRRTQENLRRAAADYFGVSGGYRRIYLS
ncbi:MAG: glycerate kinase, partial [Planctomycetes bacterium]|nr:glycerate kinase [Planctomycetota bacterium]